MGSIDRLELSCITYYEYLDTTEWLSIPSARLHHILYLIEDVRSYHRYLIDD